MRFPAILTLLLFIAFFAASAYAVFVVAPGIARTKTIEALDNVGINTAQLHNPAVRYGAIRFENIALDKEKFSTIKTLDIKYAPVKLLLFREINTLKLYGLNLTGEISEDGALSLAGWENRKIDLHTLRNTFKTLDIEGARLSLLTPHLGGITLNYDLQLIRRAQYLDFKGRVDSEQKTLSFTSRFSGNVTNHGLWQATFDIDQDRIDFGPHKASRISAKAQISGETNTPAFFLVEFTAGGLSLYDTPWQNASGTLERVNNTYSLLIGAESLGYDGIEMTFNAEKPLQGPAKVSGVLHAENMAALLEYLKALKLLPVSNDILPPLGKTAAIEAEFIRLPQEKEGEKSINYQIKNIENNIDINGKIAVLDSEYTATVSSNPIFLRTLDKDVFSSGKITLTGNVKRKGDTLSGNLQTNITDATYNAGPVQLKGISGALTLNNLSQLSMPEPQSFKCTIPLKIKHECTLKLEITKGRLNFDDLIVDTLGGQFTVERFNPLQNNQTWTIKGKGADLWKLTKTLDIQGLTGTGKMTATLPVTKRDGKLHIEQGIIENDGSGVLRYLYSRTPDFFEGDELELETIRMTLENYHYETLKVILNGPVGGEVDVLIIGRGRNPELFGAREVSLHLKTKTYLAPFLKNIAAFEPRP